ncbi:hypothetical protein LCGC14_3144620, partial [marine sediment metagenome]
MTVTVPLCAPTRPIQALQGSASPRTGPEAYQGIGKQGPEKGLTPNR